jgi:DNA-binding transcriptional ArsR family regulator
MIVTEKGRKGGISALFSLRLSVCLPRACAASWGLEWPLRTVLWLWSLTSQRIRAAVALFPQRMQRMECIYGMTTTDASAFAPQVFRQLANPTRWAIYQYLGKAKIATVSVVQRKCSVSQSLASRYLRDLASAGLLLRVRIGSVRLYEIDQRSWVAVGRVLNSVAEESTPFPTVSVH